MRVIKVLAALAAATCGLSLTAIALHPWSPVTAADATQVAEAALRHQVTGRHRAGWTGSRPQDGASRSPSSASSLARQVAPARPDVPATTAPNPLATSGVTTTAPSSKTPSRKTPSAGAPGAGTSSTVTAAAAPASTGSTGSTPPTGDLPGWHQVFVDGFDGTTLGSQWRTYSGQPGGSPYGLWSPSHVSVSGGDLVLSGDKENGQWISGGLANRTSLTYGKYEMRYRIDAGDEMGYAILLWPHDESWPPEVDFAEDAGGNRSGTTATLHYGGNDTMVEQRVAADMTQWHTIGVEWTPGTVVYTMDGKPWATTHNAGVPSKPMDLGIQIQPGGCQGQGDAFGCGVGNPGVTRLLVDWVAIYSRA